MHRFALLLAALSAAGPALAQEVSEVVVTAAPYAVSLDSVTTSVNVLTREQLDVAPPVGLGDLLNGQPGLRSTSFGPGASRPIIRGLSGPRVLILQNGVGLVDASALSPDHAVASEPSEASRIEVLRGPSTLAYGGSAIGGVVNILDERIPSKPAEGRADGRVSASYDWNSGGRALSAGLKVGTGPWVAAFDAVKRESGDYEVPVIPAPLNTDVELTAYGAGLSYVGTEGFLGASVKRTQTSYGIPHAPGASPVGIDLEQTRLDLRGEHTLDLGAFETVRASVGYADYQHAEIERATGDIGTQFLSEGIEGRLELVQPTRGGWQGAVGAQGLRRDLSAIGDEAFIPTTSIGEVGVFTLQRLDKGRWGLEGGLRLDRRTLSASLGGRPTSDAATSYGIDWATASASQDFANVSASLAAFWRPTHDWFASLSLSRNGRAPTESELFADGPHEGTGSYEIGDPTLGSEKVTSLEATLRWTGAAGRAEGHLFTARYDGFIEEAPTGDLAQDDGTLDPLGELPVFRYFQTGATFQGGELSGSYDLWRNGDRAVALEGAFDYVRGDTDAGRPARIPPYSVTAALAYESPRAGARLELRRVGEQDRTATFELPTDGYTLINASVNLRPFEDRDVRLFLDARNLGDVEAREHASFLKDIAPQPGRSIRAGLAVGF